MRSDAKAIVAYHSRGSYMYWYFGQTGARYARDKGIALEISLMTGYGFVSQEESLDVRTGTGYRDWYVAALQRPGFTLEIGSSRYPAPQPIVEFPDVWRRNRDVPLHLAWRITQTSIR